MVSNMNNLYIILHNGINPNKETKAQYMADK